MRLIKVHYSVRIKQADLESQCVEFSKFTHMDELCAFDQSLNSASKFLTSRFKNWIEEEREESVLTLKNACLYSAFCAKYLDLCFLAPSDELIGM